MVRYISEEKYTKPKTAKDVLIIAREKEKASLNFYEEMEKVFVEDSETKMLIEDLKKDEIVYIEKIENILIRLAD